MSKIPQTPAEPDITSISPSEFEQKYKVLRKRLRAGIILFVVLLVVGSSTALVLHIRAQNRKREQSLSAKRQLTVQQGLIDMLSTKTLQRKIQYIDPDNRTITYQIQSDLTTPLAPVTKGSVTVTYVKTGQRIKQTVEFVSLKNKSGGDLLYFRMTDGNQLTSASSQWYRGLQRDIRSMKEFTNFWWLEYDQINSVKGIIPVGNLGDSPAKSKIISEIQNNKAYMFDVCLENITSVWCNGSLNPGGVRSIDVSVAESESLGQSSFISNLSQPYKLTVWINKGVGGISRLTYTPTGGKDWSENFWNLNQPVDITLPGNPVDAPILGGYRSTIDASCNAQCQAQLVKEEQDRKAGHYY